ncbi:MAG: hypothetical protein HKN87_13070 [Saprospiraceae bacterium]|nr:hypothetical protein [Saprospiraceae bacterium]
MRQKSSTLLMLSMAIILLACAAEKEPLPIRTYSGEEPRIQDPLSPEDSRSHIQLPDGFTAQLFASEPDIINPIAMAWDERSRLWVVQSQDYPHGLENEVGGDRITICEDVDGDGRADKFTDFATEQSLTTGIAIVKGGIIVAQAPDMVFLEDIDGDDRMDKRRVLFGGFGIWDTHAGPSNLRYGLDNMIWGSVGYSGFESTFGEELVNFSMGVFRFSKNGDYFEPIGKFNNNTWGLGLTPDFEVFGSTANNNHCCYVGIPLRHYDYLHKRPSWAINADFIQGHYDITLVDTIPLQQVDVRGGYTAAAGANFYTATNYPSAYRNQMYVNEPTGHLVHIARIVDEGAGYKEEDGGNIFASTDAWTAPVFTETGPDGNLWVADWYNPVIQHNPDKRGMENQIWNAERGKGNAHENVHRDKGHGRIYIIKHKRGSKSDVRSLDASDPLILSAALSSENMFWRITAQRLIVENQITSLVGDLEKLAQKNTLGAVHALWSLHGLQALEGKPELLSQALKGSVGTKRAALALLPEDDAGSELLIRSGLLSDPNLHVRLAAILRAGELPETNSLVAAIEAISGNPTNLSDKWLNAAIKIYFKEQNRETISEDEVQMVVPSGEEGGTHWRYTTISPGSQWKTMDFDPADWKSGLAIFGTLNVKPNARTEWSTSDIWMRKEVTLDRPVRQPVLKVLHDEDYAVFVNDQELFAERGVDRNYRLIRLDDSKGNLFKEGKNIIAVHAHNAGGRQSIDLGIGEVVDMPPEQTFTLRTVSQKMAYDDTILHATAGQDIELQLINEDQMPHNVVLLQEGSLQAFGKLVDEFLQSPDAEQMDYVPKSRYVLGATQMLDPGDRGSIRITIPDKAGDYPFICTFPGHWRMMQGVLKVSPRGNYISEHTDALRIASMGGGGSHDFLTYFAEADGRILNQDGRNTFLYTEHSDVFEDWIASADVLFISNNKPFDVSTQKEILQHVERGRPMLIYHPSTWYNWKDWPEYNQQLVAGGSLSHEKLQAFEVEVVKPGHPIMQDVPNSFRIVDELYRWEHDSKGPNIEVLAIGRGLESREEFPVVWVVKHPKAKIVCNTLGHDNDAHNLGAYQTILSNSLDWVKPIQSKPVQ